VAERDADTMPPIAPPRCDCHDIVGSCGNTVTSMPPENDERDHRRGHGRTIAPQQAERRDEIGQALQHATRAEMMRTRIAQPPRANAEPIHAIGTARTVARRIHAAGEGAEQQQRRHVRQQVIGRTMQQGR
jgi:hypothetical protein